MGKKKPASKNNPEALKEAGNKAFINQNYPEAVKQYTLAIEITLEKPNHVYFSNRANAYLEMNLFEECIADCNQAISIEASFVKPYYRKAKALIGQSKLVEAMETLKDAITLDPENQDYVRLMQEC